MQEQPKRRGAPFLQKIFFIFILFVILSSIGLWYVNEYVMPTKGKSLIVDYLTKATGREVTLENIYYNPFRGIALENLTISDDPKYNRKFLEVKKLYLNILYLPLLQEKKLMISSVRVASPKIVLTIDDKNKWNFETLAFLNKPKPATEQMNVLVNSVVISDARFTFEDLALQPVFRKELTDLDFQASLSYPLKIKYRLNSRLNINQSNSISADGQFDPAKKNATLNLKLKTVPLAEFQQYYAGLQFKSLTGILSGNISASYSLEDNLTVATVSSINNLALVRDDFTAKSAVDLSGKISVDLRDRSKAKMPCVISAAAKLDKVDFTAKDFAVKGGVDANGKFSFDLKDKAALLKYTANATLRDTRISGVPAFGAIDKLNGKIYFDETKLWTDMMKGLAKGLDCVFSGSIKDYANPYMNLTANTALDLSRLDEFLTPELKEKLKGYTFSGITKINLNVSGLLKQQDKTPLAYQVTSDLLDCSIKPDFLDKPLKSINGKLIAKQNSVSLKNVSAFFGETRYLVSADVTELNAPLCDVSLSSDDLKLKTVFKYLKDSATFKKFEGRYKNTVFDLTGSFGDFKDPALDIKGTIITNLAEMLPYIPKANFEFLNKFNPETTLSSGFELKGKAKKPETWNLTINKFEGKSNAFDLSALGSIADFKEPLLDLRGSLTTNIEEVKKFLPSGQAELLSKNEVGGDISSKFVFKGKQKDQNTWQADLIVDSQQLRIKKLKFDDCHIEGKFKDKFVNFPKITANPYDGSLTANAVIDLNQKNPQYVIQAGLRDMDIAKWKNDTPSRDKNLSGRFSANGEFGGFSNDLETLKGKGQFQISNGNFWELPVFSGLANILYIPGVSKIAFGEARGTFTVSNKKIYTDDTVMSSQQMNLLGNGAMDFDGNLDFQLTATFDKSLLEVASPLGPLRDLLIDKEGHYLGDITLGGTTKEPKFKVNPIRLDKILQNKLIDNIKGIFGGGSE